VLVTLIAAMLCATLNIIIKHAFSALITLIIISVLATTIAISNKIIIAITNLYKANVGNE
jgi:hypothetical protein